MLEFDDPAHGPQRRGGQLLQDGRVGAGGQRRDLLSGDPEAALGCARVGVAGEASEPRAGTRVEVTAMPAPGRLHVHAGMLARPAGLDRRSAPLSAGGARR